jgi:hypothetical protein
MFTDGAATVANTSTPSFTSVSYAFQATDIGAWLYVALGTNCILGWYNITNVIAGAAILNATIGQAVLKTTLVPSTVVGCATVASPTGMTWTADYSQQTGLQVAYLDLASAGTGLLISSAAKPFGRQQVGNGLVVTGGTNLNPGRYVIASVAAVTFIATVVGPTNITTGAGLNGTGSLGGAWASPGAAAALTVPSLIALKTGTYSITSATANIAAGCVSLASGQRFVGYGTVRGDFLNPPTLQASGISTAVLVTHSSNGDTWSANVIADGASLTSIRGFAMARGAGYKLTGINCTNNAFILVVNNAATLLFCKATGCSTQPAFSGRCNFIHCEAYSNTVTGFSTDGPQYWFNCLAYNNTGASSDGFAYSGQAGVLTACVAYANGRDGFRLTSNAAGLINCIAESNVGIGINDTGAGQPSGILFNCAVYSNGTNVANTPINPLGSLTKNLITGTASFFTNAAGGDFSLNNTAGGGALLRAVGFPGTFPTGTTIGYVDIGAAQHKDAGGMPLSVMAVI